MPFSVPIDDAKAAYPEYTFIAPLTPSEQKAAFHVQDRSGSDLCLKIIAPTCDIDRVQREILALQAISHPNVVALREYTFSTSNGRQRHYLVEDFVAGTDMAQLLQPGVPWSTEQASDFFAQLCEGLAALRAAAVVHRDLKPTNIRVRPDGSPVIVDFGLARHLRLSDLTLSTDGARLGTPLYFAPEQWEGTKRDIDHRTDLFAVGILLYQALVGRHPFVTPTMTTLPELQEAVCRSSDFLNEPQFQVLPKQCQLFVARLLEKERARRPQDASQAAHILRRLRSVA